MAASECDLVVDVDDHGTTTRLVDAWVYVREAGALTVGRADHQGDIFGFGGSGDKTMPLNYTRSFRTHLDASVDAFFSKGAKPIPDAQVLPALQARKVEQLASASGGFSCTVGPGGVVNSIRRVALGRIELPPVVLGVDTPAELSLWVALLEPLDERAPPPPSAGAAPRPDVYYLDGIPQRAAWFAQHNARSLENTASGAPSDPVRPRTRGLRVEGFIDARATGVKIQLFQGDTAVNLLQDGWDPQHSARVTELAADMRPASGDRTPFSATLFLGNAPNTTGPTQDVVSALGPVQIVIQSSGGITPPVVGSFSYHLVGAQVALVDDHVADAAGTRAGPVPGEADDVQVLDYVSSPLAIAAPFNAAAQAAARAQLADQSRTRRMVRYPIRANRSMDFTLPALAARANPTPQPALAAQTVQVVQPEMPLWMAELQLVGIAREDIEDLIIRRVARDPSASDHVAFELDWELQLEWHGPDKDAPGAVVLPPFAASIHQNFSLQLDNNKDLLQRKLTGVDSTGRVAGALAPAPAPLSFPISGRRTPALTMFQNGSGPTRTWGRQGGSSVKSTVLEWQPSISSGGDPIIRGGDGRLALTALRIDGNMVDAGIVFARPTAPPDPPPANPHTPASPAAGAPIAHIPRFRVEGENPSPPDRNVLVDAVVEDVFRRNAATSRWLDFLPLAVWQATARLMLGHESGGRQFAVPLPSGPSGIGMIAFGHEIHGRERDMPLYGPPHGYGIGQIDPPGTQDRVWSFTENLREAARRLMIEKGQGAMSGLGHEFSNPAGVLSQRSRAVFHRQTVRAYNGGREFHFDTTLNDWVIQPSVLHNTRVEPDIYYPDMVLGTNVPYQHLLPTPNQRQPNAPAAPAISTHIAFTPAMFFPGI